MRKLALICVTALVLNGCSLFGMGEGGADGGEAGGADNAEVKAAIKAAEDAIKKSAAAGGEWRDAKNVYIKKAKAALAKGDLKAAMKNAEIAKFQGEMGVKQAAEQTNAKPWLF